MASQDGVHVKNPTFGSWVETEVQDGVWRVDLGEGQEASDDGKGGGTTRRVEEGAGGRDRQNRRQDRAVS